VIYAMLDTSLIQLQGDLTEMSRLYRHVKEMMRGRHPVDLYRPGPDDEETDDEETDEEETDEEETDEEETDEEETDDEETHDEEADDEEADDEEADDEEADDEEADDEDTDNEDTDNEGDREHQSNGGSADELTYVISKLKFDADGDARML
jgi:cobalamin biosynthesis protein CobT